MDYWSACLPSDKPPKVPLVYDKENRAQKRRMTPEEYEIFLRMREARRKREKADAEAYFRSPVYALTTDADPQKLMARLELLRKRGRRVGDMFPETE